MPLKDHLLPFYFVVIGIGYLFPFSCLTLPVDYWRLLFPNENILFTISPVYLFTNLGLLIFLVFWHTNSFSFRITVGFIGQLLCLIAIPTSYFLHADVDANKIIVLSCTAILALVTAFLDSSLISLAGCFPHNCQAALQLGVGVSTLIGCLYRVGTKLAFPESNDGTVVSSLIYFYTGSFTIFLCLCVYFILINNEEAKRFINLSLRGNNDQEESIESPLLNENGEELKEESESFSKMKAFKKSWFNGLCVAFLFVSTTAVWPGLITEIPAYQISISKDWYSLLLLNVFAVTDVIGRFMVPWRFGFTKNTIWIPVALRVLLIPAVILVVNGQIFTHDVWSFVFVSILGWSNGWCGSQTIIMLNETTDDPQERRYIGTLASFYLNGGLVIGAIISFLSFGSI